MSRSATRSRIVVPSRLAFSSKRFSRLSDECSRRAATAIRFLRCTSLRWERLVRSDARLPSTAPFKSIHGSTAHAALPLK